MEACHTIDPTEFKGLLREGGEWKLERKRVDGEEMGVGWVEEERWQRCEKGSEERTEEFLLAQF